MHKLVYVILSFEGPDNYSRAGGLGSRINELSYALAEMGHETHLFFIGDPSLPGVETAVDGRLHLHRWCQWISQHHPAGVYDGEEGKVRDWTASVPPWLETNLLPELVSKGSSVTVLAEEWQTVGSVIALNRAIERNGWTSNVRVFWNLNNPFGTHQIDWAALRQSAVITTVSRYMKQFMSKFGVDARVIPNGISSTWFEPPDFDATDAVRRFFGNRLTLVKIARWDPDKRWTMAVDAISVMKREGLQPVLLARGSGGSHGEEVLARADILNLSVKKVGWSDSTPDGLVRGLHAAEDADILLLHGFLNQPQLKVLSNAADAVLANSGVEPFGLVGLEVMASGGVAFVGATGEDYATPGYDCISVQTDSPSELAYHAGYIKRFATTSRAIRRTARETAHRYAWSAVIARALEPLIQEFGGEPSVSAEMATTPITPSYPLPVSVDGLEVTPRLARGLISGRVKQTQAGQQAHDMEPAFVMG